MVVNVSTAGIGGGGILIPLFVLILKFDPKHAVPLTAITIMVSCSRWRPTCVRVHGPARAHHGHLAPSNPDCTRKDSMT